MIILQKNLFYREKTVILLQNSELHIYIHDLVMLLVLLLVFFLLCVYRADIKLAGIQEDYMSKMKTDSIKGIFIVIVVLKHAIGYLNKAGYTYSAFGDAYYSWFVCSQSQLIVVMFLFYSGYGVSESFKRKGNDYLKGFPKHRILKTLLNFDVAVIAFAVLGLLLGAREPLLNYLIALSGWESLGNSNWYFFVIILCYSMTWVVLCLPLKYDALRVTLLFSAIFLCLVLLWKYKDGTWWYDTILTFPMGFLFSTYKNGIEKYVKTHYWLVLGLISLLFLVQFMGFYKSIYSDSLNLAFNLLSITFALLIIVVTMKVSLNNKPLQWLGMNLFPIYIYMRIPMIILAEKQPELLLRNPAAFTVISLALTLLIAHFYHYWQIDFKRNL